MILTDFEKNSLKTRLLNNSVPEPNTGCWLWELSSKHFRYGAIGIGRRKVEFAHRASYMVFVGNIPKGLVVRHKCDTPECINPNHLEIGSRSENTKDMMLRGRHSSFKQTHCKNGHEYILENTYFSKNHKTNKEQRICKKCKQLYLIKRKLIK